MTSPFRARGFTLAELMTGTFVATLVLGVVLSVFVLGRGAWRSAQASYMLSREVGVALATLRADLEETSLGSVRVSEKPSGLSMATARDGESLLLLPSGAPRWRGHVLYVLDPEGRLVRWVREEAGPGLLPRVCPVPPWPTVAGRVVMRHLLPPGKAVVDGRVVDDAASPGGFVPRFVRRDSGRRTLSVDGPTRYTDGERSDWSKGNTLLVQVDLQVLEIDEESGLPSSLKMDVVAVPRN